MWIDFSSPESVNENWERLVRVLFGRPQYKKPTLGRPPSYITSDSPHPTSGIVARFQSLRQAIFQEREMAIRRNRSEFLDACFNYADESRVRSAPSVESIGEYVLEQSRKLKLVRDPLIDWVLLEGESTPENEFSETLIEFLERLRELKSRPVEITTWRDAWFEAHSLFVYEIFLYFVAALLKTKSYQVLGEIYSAHYVSPVTERHGGHHFERFDTFYGFSESLESILAPEGRRLQSPAAELLKRQSDRHDLPFPEVIQAELITTLVSVVQGFHWYPQTALYSPYHSTYPFFVRAEQHKYFVHLAVITGIESGDVRRSAAREGLEKLSTGFRPMRYFMNSFWSLMNMDRLDTL